MPLPYRQVKDLYDVLHAAGATQLDMPTWAQQMAGDTGSDLYSAGLNDNWIKRGSVGIDRLLEATGLPEVGSNFGRSFGDVFGMGEQGAQIGQNLPRMAVNLAPLSFGPLGLGVSGALAGAETYTETNSPAAGLLSGITNMLLPGVAGKAEQGTLAFLRNQGLKRGVEEGLLPRLVEGANASKWLNPTTPAGIEAVSQLFPRTFGHKGASFVGGQLAAAGLMGASDVGQSVLAGDGLKNPFTPEMALNLTLGQLPFALLHLGGKAAGLGPKYHGFDESGNPVTKPLTAELAADSLQRGIDATKVAVDNQNQAEALRKQGIASIPDVTNPITFSEEQQKQHDTIMADLSKKQEDLKANPSPENLAELDKVTQAKDEVLAKAIDEGHPTIGVSKPYAGAIPVTGENHYRKEDSGYNVITVKDFPAGLTYNNGTPVQVGDRISFSDGKFPSGVNKDGTDKFQLGVGKDGKKYFTKVEDKQAVVPTDKGDLLPIQQAEFNHQQYTENLKTLSEVEEQLPAISSYSDAVDALEKVNEVRRQTGYPEISFPSLIREAKRRKIKGDKQSVQALIAETRRMQIAEQIANQAHMDTLRKEVEFRQQIEQQATPGSDAEIIKSMYDDFSRAGGNREEIASSGLFWRKAMELQEKGVLTPERLKASLKSAIESGTGLKGNVQLAPKLEGPVFQALSSEDATAYQLGAEAVLKVTQNAPNSDEAKVFKRVITNAAGGHVKDINQLFGKEAVAEALVDLGLSEEGPDANLFAEDIIKSPLVKDWVKQLGDQTKHLPPGFIEGEFSKISNAPGRIEEKQPSAGGGFVWGMQNYDLVQNKLGKHTLPKSGILSDFSLKQIGGRNGKPLQDVEIEMMKAIDKSVDGGAFEGGMVDVRKLQKVLSENPVEVHVYGQDGADTPAKIKFDQMTHDWFDNLSPTDRRVVEESRDLSTLSPEDQATAAEYIRLNERVMREPSGHGPRATSYYNQISPFDTKKYPVVRVDVSLPMRKSEEAIAKSNRHRPITEHGDAYKDGGLLWSPDNLHENLPNTLGWAMVQFVPDGKGNTVMFVGEQQSRWGQERQAAEKDLKRHTEEHLKVTGKPLDEKGKEAFLRLHSGAESHPLLPLQHVLVLKAAAQEAARRGVTKMVVSDGPTVGMTEMHDKVAAISKITWPDGTIEIKDGVLNGEYLAGVEAKGGKVEITTSKAKGINLHYDTTLSSAAKKLTGSEGEKWEGGTHKNVEPKFDLNESDPEYAALRSRMGSMGINEYQDAVDSLRARKGGSPVFKNPDGTPKSSITGREYDLSSIQETARAQGGLTLGDPSRIGKPEEKAFVPTAEQKPIHDVLSGSGEDLVNHLLTSEYPEYQALAKDLLKSFPEALRATRGQVKEGYGTAATWVPLDNRMGSHIAFHPSVLTMSSGTQDTVIIHELGHALSMNLLEKGLSPELETKLEDIRNRAIANLPKKLRDQYNKLNAEGFIAKSRAGKLTDAWDQVGPESEGFSNGDRQILYGVLDNHELIGQSWSSDSFKNYLKKLPGKVNGLEAFVNWTKKLFGFGDKHDNLLRELIETSHALMSHGEFLTSAEEYGKSYFEMKGEAPAYGQAQTNRALELLEDSKTGTTPELIAGSLAMSQGRANPELNRRRAILDRLFQDTEALGHEDTKNLLQELGHEPTTNGVDDMVISAMAEGHDLNDALAILPVSVQKYVFAKLKDQKDIVEMLQSATAEKNKGVVNIAKPELVRKPLFEVGKRIDRMLEAEAKEQEHAQDLVGLSGVDPYGFLKSQLSYAPGKIEEKPQDGKIPIDRSFLSRFLETMGNLALRFPEVSEIITKGFQLVSNGRKLQNNSLKIFGANLKSEYLDVTDKETIGHMKKMMADPHLRAGVYEWIGENQFRNKDAVTMLDESDPAIAKLKQRYTNDQWEIVRDFVTKQGLSRQKWNSDKLQFLQGISATRGGGIISESGLKTGENIAIADSMLKAVQGMRDPLQAEGSKAQFQDIRNKLKNPDDFLALLEYSKNEVEKLGMLKETLDKNPFWAPAQRMEQYLVEGLKGGKAWTQSYSSKKEAEIEVKKNGVTLLKPIKDQWADTEDTAFKVPGLTPDMLKRAKEIEENQIKILTKAGVIKSADDLEKYRQSSIPLQMAREADAGTGTSGLNAPPRNLSKGAEDLPWLRNHIVGIQREARFLARQLLRAQADTYLKHPELQENDQIRNDLRTHFDNILHPDPQLAQKMTRFASTWFMGFNLASTLVNATQPFLTHVSELTAITGRPLESYKRVTRALKEAMTGLHGKKNWATEEHSRLMKEEAEEGNLDMSMWDTDAQDHESVSTDLLRALDKQKPQTLGQKLSSAAGVYSTVAMMPFKAVERINASAALLASFDYYREQGLSYEEAKEKASTFNRGVNYSGGRGQRPVLAFAGRGAYPRGSAMLGTALQSYVLGTTGQIARYLQSGFFRPKGLTPYEVYSARKAAAQMLGTQLAAAGLLGLPFVSGAIALLDKLFPELELNKKIREGVGSFLSSDQENGSPLSDIAMTGVPSMMGWDLQSRLSMGNTLPGVSEVNGFQPENLIGPVANIVKNFVGGVQGWAQGDPGSTGKFLPPAVRKLVEAGKATLTDGGAIRDYQGRPLSEPTVGENLGLAIGFQPKRLSDQNAASRILRQTTEVENQKAREENQRLAGEVMKGNYGTVRQTLLSKMQSDKNYNPEDVVRAIAQNVEDVTLPRDLRREGDIRTSGQRSGLLSSFSNLSSSGSVSEVARLQLRMGVEQKLGLNRPQTGELKVAQMMDQLRTQSPELTRAQLRQQAQNLLRRSARSGQMSLE